MVPLAVLAGETVPQPGAQAKYVMGPLHGWKGNGLQVRRPSIRVQLTPPLLESLLTVAVNGCVPPEGTEAEGGATDTLIPVTEIVAEPDLVESVTDVAVIVTVIDGEFAGAV